MSVQRSVCDTGRSDGKVAYAAVPVTARANAAGKHGSGGAAGGGAHCVKHTALEVLSPGVSGLVVRVPWRATCGEGPDGRLRDGYGATCYQSTRQ